MTDRTMDLIRSANPYPEGLPPLPIGPVMQRLAEAGSHHPAPRRGIPLPSVGGVVAAVSVRLGLGRWGVRHWSMVAVTAAGMACTVVLAVFAGSAPTVAQAFPVLGGHAVLTPTSLRQALKIYGVGLDNAGLNIRQGHPVTTPWGTGYVLTNSDRSVICLLAPGTAEQPWGASCARTDIARHHGTAFEYGYDKRAGSARFIALLPARATATAQLGDGQPHTLPIHAGVLAFEVTHPTILNTRIDGHANVVRLIPVNASPGARSTVGAETTTTASATDSPAGQ